MFPSENTRTREHHRNPWRSGGGHQRMDRSIHSMSKPSSLQYSAAVRDVTADIYLTCCLPQGPDRKATRSRLYSCSFRTLNFRLICITQATCPSVQGLLGILCSAGRHSSQCTILADGSSRHPRPSRQTSSRPPLPHQRIVLHCSRRDPTPSPPIPFRSRLLKHFQKRNVSSPAPVTTVCPSGLIAR